MKKTISTLIAIFCVFAMCFAIVSCEFGTGKGEEELIDYTNYTSDFSIKVKNNTTKNLVAFKGAPSANNLLGGIPAGPGNEHGLKMNTTLFSTSSDFPLFLITEEDYINNKNNLGILVNSPFSIIYAYYNTNAVNNTIFEISASLGGDCIIKLNNTSGFNVELRKDKTDGEVLGYASSADGTTKFRVESDTYTLYPVFRKFVKSRNEIITVFPCKNNNPGQPWYTYFDLKSGEERSLFTSTWFDENTTIDTGCAYLVINNNNIGSACSFFNGSTLIKTSTGRYAINSGDFLMFQIDMELENGIFLQSRTITGYRIETPSNEVYLPRFTFESGKIYEIEVMGNDGYDISISDIKLTGEIDFANM